MKQAQKLRCAALIVAAVAVAAVVFVAAGCSELGGTSITTAGAGTTLPGAATTEVGETTTSALDTTTLPPAVTTAPVSVGASEELLPNGRIKACGIIKEVWMDGNVRKIKIDYVDFLVGAAADAAAVADGIISPGEHVDNDYYVRNNNTKLRTFTVSNSVSIVTYSRSDPLDAPDAPCSWSDFYDFWNLIGPPLPSDMGLYEGLWWIERDPASNVVLKIEQQWVP